MSKSAMRHAFEAAKVTQGGISAPVVQQVLRVMERGSGVRQPRPKQQPRKQGTVPHVREQGQPSDV